MKTVIVWVTAEQKADADRACAGIPGLERPIQVVENPAQTTNTLSEAYWRYEVPESAAEKHPEWKVVTG
ncbi:hypothetical protein [Paraburkholderia sp. GAS348]|uniref:hypothetical protein n=1 Tax=Paraburkholderia sp. GAS348 TaxID=3035132 RepID=UPI003D1F83A5